MKIVIISDSHGNIANINYVLEFAKKIRAKAIIHCGDWDNIKGVEKVLSFEIPLYAVLGNADVDPEISKRLKVKTKRFDEKFLEIELGGRKIGIIHSIEDCDLKIKNCDIVFAGHRHYKGEKIEDGIKIVHLGALHSIKPSFAVYDTDINKVEFFDL